MESTISENEKLTPDSDDGDKTYYKIKIKELNSEPRKEDIKLDEPVRREKKLRKRIGK